VSTAEPREGARTAKRAAVQAAVLAATEGLLSEGARYADLNVERITARAGISRTAFYFYFRDKRDLLMRLTEDVNEQLFQQADIWFSGAGEPEQEVRRALTNIAALWDAHGVLLRAIVEVAASDEEVAAFWRGTLGRFVDATRRRIKAEQAAGSGAPGDPEAIAFALCWMTERTLYQQLAAERPLAPAPLVDALARIWLRAVYALG
jgi:TetR/AcrR family transcriptional regulator, ethionamide resistance regulator